MPVTSVTSDPDALIVTLVGEYPVPVDRLWAAWADPRRLERFWGPPGWPATFTRHDMAVGGRSEYVMSGPDGERPAGYWVFEAIDPCRSIEVVDGFANEDGSANDEMPTMRMRMTFQATDDGSRMTVVTAFRDLATMEQLAAMGMVEGATAAFGQIDGVLADLAAFAADRVAEAQVLDDLHLRVSRIVRGSVEQVWQAHHDAELVRRWMLGPDGWTMPVCEVATSVGDTYRYEWESDDDASRFGFEGELVESTPPHRAVTTERPIGSDGAGTRNELTLTAVDDRHTLISLLIVFPTRELRDQTLATGMIDGVEASYARLERTLSAAV